jgi:hypothetical protein
VISGIGLLFILIGLVPRWCGKRVVVRVASVVFLVGICYLVWFLEEVFKRKRWYNPHFWPDEDFSKGSLASDQGNNI